MKELTQAQRIFLDTMNATAEMIGEDQMTEERLFELISEDHANGHFIRSVLQSMDTYARIKWDEACNGLREDLIYPLIANDFFVTHINPEFKP